MKKENPPRQCLHCHADFKWRRKDKRYCGTKCKLLASQARRGIKPSIPWPEITCGGCGGRFQPKRQWQKYCDSSCRLLAWILKQEPKTQKEKAYNE